MNKGFSDIELIAFPGAPNLPIFVAEKLGFFNNANLHVNLTTTTSSPYQIKNLVEGKYQIAGTAIDNVIAYQEGQGAVELSREPDLFVFMGATKIELSFAVAPEIEGYQDLKGKTLAMDALSTGFAFVLYHMLDQAGLAPEDTTLVAVGATPQRWESVKSGDHAGTLLIEPFTSMARNAGYRILESSTEALPDYQGGIFTASRNWARLNSEALTGFIKGYLTGLDWCLQPGNFEDAKITLLENMPSINPAAAEQVLSKTLSPATGLTPKAFLDLKAVQTVLDLRNKYGKDGTATSDPLHYIDLSYYNNAVKNLGN